MGHRSLAYLKYSAKFPHIHNSVKFSAFTTEKFEIFYFIPNETRNEIHRRCVIISERLLLSIGNLTQFPTYNQSLIKSSKSIQNISRLLKSAADTLFHFLLFALNLRKM